MATVYQTIDFHETLDSRQGRGPASERGVFVLLIVAVGMVLCSGCNRRPADLTGTYLGNYFGGQETLILQRDGSFSQQFVLNGSPLYRNTGRWALNGSQVHFTNFIPVIFYFKMGHGQEHLKPLDSFNGTIRIGGGTIVFYDDADYFVQRH